MMKIEDYLLTLLTEEASEIIQAVTKSLRFGLESDYIGKTNQQCLITEINDLFAVVEILQEFGSLPVVVKHDDLIEAKKVKIKKYLRMSQNLKRVDVV